MPLSPAAIPFEEFASRILLHPGLPHGTQTPIPSGTGPGTATAAWGVVLVVGLSLLAGWYLVYGR